MLKQLRATAFLAGFLCSAVLATGAAAQSASYHFDIPGKALSEALRDYGQVSGLDIIFTEDLVRGLGTAGLLGEFTPEAALQRLLQGTGLIAERSASGALMIQRVEVDPQLASEFSDSKAGSLGQRNRLAAQAVGSKAAERETDDTDDEGVMDPEYVSDENPRGIPEIMVIGSRRTLNMDIERTENDPQPYVVFDRAQIERSGVSSLEQFLQQRLTMNTSGVNSGRGTATSQIRLRGLSSAQTLILIDGHRVSSPSLSSAGFGSIGQADITGIPLAAIERIEVLPTTASGIYGGSATGGVINIIMRRDYRGAEIKLSYENTFSSDSATRKLDVIAGHSFNEGKTNLLVTASYSGANELLMGDRNLGQRGREAVWNNNQAWFLAPNGLPPLGATPNIASSDGSSLVLDDGTPLNASFTSVPVGYPGSSLDGGAALVTNAGRYNWDLANSAQQNTRDSGREQALYTQPTVQAGSVVLRHQFGDSLQVFTDLSSSHAVNRFSTSRLTSHYSIPADSPNNPFAQAIRIAVPLHLGSESDETTTIDHHRALMGLVKQLPLDWQLGFDYTWDRTTVSSSQGTSAPGLEGVIETGAIDILRDTNAFPVDIGLYTVSGARTSPFQTTMKDAVIRISGPVGRLPGGAAILSASLAHRDEKVPDSFFFLPADNRTTYYPDRSQSVTSGYLELRVPVFSDKNTRPGVRELELQVAVRRDDYTSKSGEVLSFAGADELPTPLPEVVRGQNEFASVDPTVAIRWKPWEDFTLRASYGTGFVPPALDQVVASVLPFLLSAGNDPLRGNTPAGPYTFIFGGNPGLKPEQSKSWSAGLILAPRVLPNLRLSVDYTRIEKNNNIANHPGFFQGIIDDESQFPDRVVRGPNLPGDPPDWAGPITQLDASFFNLAKAELEAWDVQLDFRKGTERYGDFDLFFIGTWQPHFKVQAIDGEPVVDHVGISFRSPLEFKANAGLAWSRANWQAGWSINYFDSYQVSADSTFIVNQGGNGKVPNQTYHDVFFTYDFGLGGDGIKRWMAGTELQLGIRNIFNKEPPLDAASFSGDFISRFGDPRLSVYYLSIKHQF